MTTTGGRGGVVPPGVTGDTKPMAQLKVTQVKSKIGGTSEQRNSLRSLGLRRIGHPDDVAALAVFLASAKGRHIQGTAIAVDGGGTPGYY